jgi:hypothetical protein
MQAMELIIEAKKKPSPFAIVSPGDFAFRSGAPVVPRAVLERATVSLYCLDHENRRALFVETDPERDLLQAPFYFIAQYDAARRLIAVSYEVLEALLAVEKIAPTHIVLLYSTGRCGSTLLSHVLNLSPSVVSFAEPDVFSQLVKLRASGTLSDDETASWLRICLLTMAANARRHGFSRYVFKFRSYVLSVSDLLRSAVPDAGTLFLYRNARSWARSFSRSFGISDQQLKENLLEHGFRYMVPSVDAHLLTHSDQISWATYLAHMWVSTMQACRALRQAGATVAHASFEELKANPESTIHSLLARCDIPLPDADKLAAALAKDSQSGTEGAQDRGAPARLLTDSELDELENSIREIDPTLEPDTRLRD